MRGAVLYGPREVRFEERDVPRIIKPTDAIIKISPRACAGLTYGHTAESIRLPNRRR